METIGERVTRLRKALDLTQEELAKKAGVAQSTIGGIEKDARNKMPSSIVEIAHALDVDAYWLKTGRGNYAIKYGAACTTSVQVIMAEEPKPANIISMPSPLIAELAAAAGQLNDSGLHRLIERAQQLAVDFPRVSKGNAAQ